MPKAKPDKQPYFIVTFMVSIRISVYLFNSNSSPHNDFTVFILLIASSAFPPAVW